MPLNSNNWRPITFQGVTFPATLMGISILEPVLAIVDNELNEWLLRLTACRGLTKKASSDICARCAQKMIKLMVEHRQSVLAGIRDRLTPHGFDAERCYSDWIKALQLIREISLSANGDCYWSAPSSPDEQLRMAEDLERFTGELDGDET